MTTQMDDATRRRYEGSGGAAAGLPTTFGQLQQNGQARPPSPGGMNFDPGMQITDRGMYNPHQANLSDFALHPQGGGQGGGGWGGNWSGSGGWGPSGGSGGLPSVDMESRGVPSGRPPSGGQGRPSWADPRAIAADPGGWARQSQQAQGTQYASQYQPGAQTPPGATRPAGPPGSGWGTTPGQMPQLNGQPDLSGAFQHQYASAGVPSFGGGPQSNFHPGNYQGPGNFDAYQQSNYYHPGNYQLPQVQQQGHFTAPRQGQQVDNRTQQSVMEALGNPSRYGSQQAQDTFNVLNHAITQQGNADYGRINEDMARRGIYASTTAGGRLGDLATNLNQQRADMATNLATDQARQYQTDRSSAIGQALGYGGQQFSQGLAGFGANQQAGQQHFEQQLGRGQFGLQQQGQNFGEQMAQNAQNFGQQYQQYGANQQEAMNRYNAGYQNAQFGLNQNAQNYGQGANTYGLNLQGNAQGFGQQMAALGGLQNFGQAQFNNQLQQSQFNSDQDYRNTQLMLNMLGIQ